jgi:hypothetical protein
MDRTSNYILHVYTYLPAYLFYLVVVHLPFPQLVQSSPARLPRLAMSNQFTWTKMYNKLTNEN